MNSGNITIPCNPEPFSQATDGVKNREQAKRFRGVGINRELVRAFLESHRNINRRGDRDNQRMIDIYIGIES
jgi:hypothetical protein